MVNLQGRPGLKALGIVPSQFSTFRYQYWRHRTRRSD
jgi:hypothetical protein